MYSKTRLGSDQTAGALSLTPRGKRIVYLIVAVLVAAGVAIGVWSAVSHDQLRHVGERVRERDLRRARPAARPATTAARRPSRSAGGLRQLRPDLAARPAAVRPGRADQG